jgi:hypothetical protein
MRGRGLKSLADVSKKVRETVPRGSLSAQIQAAFRLPPGSLSVRRDGDFIVLSSQDKTVQFALRGMEGKILGFLSSTGQVRLKGVRWSAT